MGRSTTLRGRNGERRDSPAQRLILSNEAKEAKIFTGIVEAVGRICRIVEREEGRRLTVEAPELAVELEPGASVAVDGACLTVTHASPEAFTADVIGTTLGRTVAGRYREGSLVNLERALAVGDRLEGHWVQGHVDGLGYTEELRREGTHRLLDISLPPEIWALTVLHGSIALNGVSLTVNALEEPDRCQVALIPHTWEHTNLSSLEPGDPVNVEGDLIGKHVGKIVRSELGDPRRLWRRREPRGDRGASEERDDKTGER